MGGKAFDILYAHGLGFPEVTEDRPWEHPVLKVRNKVFVFFGSDDPDELSLTVKLPVSRDFAETFDFASPAGYGLGRSGWISCRFAAAEQPDLDLLKRWLAESYRAVAPKKLGALLPADD
jgi:predicted DNA-binding protein (MmcQ/YjbR family)